LWIQRRGKRRERFWNNTDRTEKKTKIHLRKEKKKR
jgi:hypothetical protein